MDVSETVWSVSEFVTTNGMGKNIVKGEASNQHWISNINK